MKFVICIPELASAALAILPPEVAATVIYVGSGLETSEEHFDAVQDAVTLAQADNGLMARKATVLGRLTEACRATITGGYKSTALGTEHTYPSSITDQINMMGSVTDSLLPNLPSTWETPFWCKDQAGSWAMRLHNASQIQQAGRDGKAHVLECQTTLDALSQEVSTANTIEEIDAIAWSP